MGGGRIKETKGAAGGARGTGEERRGEMMWGEGWGAAGSILSLHSPRQAYAPAPVGPRSSRGVGEGPPAWGPLARM